MSFRGGKVDDAVLSLNRCVGELIKIQKLGRHQPSADNRAKSTIMKIAHIKMARHHARMLLNQLNEALEDAIVGVETTNSLWSR